MPRCAPAMSCSCWPVCPRPRARRSRRWNIASLLGDQEGFGVQAEPELGRRRVAVVLDESHLHPVLQVVERDQDVDMVEAAAELAREPPLVKERLGALERGAEPDLDAHPAGEIL